VQPTLQRIQETYGPNIRLVWKHLPLPNHRDAVGAALAAEAAGRQGKFWEFHDKLFANQKKLQREALTQYARELQLDMTRFEADLGAREAQGRIDADAAEALSLGVDGTPGFFINGRFISGAQAFETFAAIIDEELAKVKIRKPASSPN
jgi:protein-disulfide isomerase